MEQIEKIRRKRKEKGKSKINMETANIKPSKLNFNMNRLDPIYTDKPKKTPPANDKPNKPLPPSPIVKPTKPAFREPIEYKQNKRPDLDFVGAYNLWGKDLYNKVQTAYTRQANEQQENYAPQNRNRDRDRNRDRNQPQPDEMKRIGYDEPIGLLEYTPIQQPEQRRYYEEHEGKHDTIADDQLNIIYGNQNKSQMDTIKKFFDNRLSPPEQIKISQTTEYEPQQSIRWHIGNDAYPPDRYYQPYGSELGIINDPFGPVDRPNINIPDQSYRPYGSMSSLSDQTIGINAPERQVMRDDLRSSPERQFMSDY